MDSNNAKDINLLRSIQNNKLVSLKLKLYFLFLGLIILSSCGNDKIKNTPQTPNPPTNFEVPETDPPPIIIKSGSFVFEADNELNLTETKDPSASATYSYDLTDFDFKSLWVCHFNYLVLVPQPCKSYTVATTATPLTLKFWFENNTASPDATIKQMDKSFQLFVNKKMKCKKINTAHREKRCEDDEPDSLNITQIQINAETPIMIGNGDIYTFSYYKK